MENVEEKNDKSFSKRKEHDTSTHSHPSTHIIQAADIQDGAWFVELFDSGDNR